MTLARLILMNALTRLVSRNAEATNINVTVPRPSPIRTASWSLANSKGP